MTEDIKKSIADTVGNTPLVLLRKISEEIGQDCLVMGKLEGNNPAGSVKDRPAFSMLVGAQTRGEISKGDRLIEATSGNTGIALAMMGTVLGYKITLIMPENISRERKLTMSAYGANLIFVSEKSGMEGARDEALSMQAQGMGKVLDQFSNPDCVQAHLQTTGPEIWNQTNGQITHFVSSMGTTGTIMGVSSYLKKKNPKIQIIGLQPKQGSSIPGIRRWPESHRPKIFDPAKVDGVIEVSQEDAEAMTRKLALEEGILCGVSAGGAVWGAVQIVGSQVSARVVCIICDRGDRYLSTDLFCL